MSLTRFKLEKWGPKKLRGILSSIEEEINQRSPIPGPGIDISEEPDGRKITTQLKPSASGEGGGDGGGGTSVDIYGARAGAPAVFHLVQTAPPSAP